MTSLEILEKIQNMEREKHDIESQIKDLNKKIMDLRYLYYKIAEEENKEKEKIDEENRKKMNFDFLNEGWDLKIKS